MHTTSKASKKAGLVGTSMALDGSIQLGDIILSINGIDVDSDVGAYSVVNEAQGGKLNVKILRRFRDKYIQKFVTVALE